MREQYVNKKIIEATNGKLLSGRLEDDIQGFTQDTRTIQKGDMYIPIISENADGHDFLLNRHFSMEQVLLLHHVSLIMLIRM